MKSERNKNIIWFLVGLSALTLVRFLPLLEAPLHTYGYDYGFYLYAAEHGGFSWQSLLIGITGGYNSFLFPVLHLFGVSAEAGLNALMFLASVSVGAAFYFVWEDKRAAFWSVVLAALSIPQSESYLLFLFKTELGLAFLLLSFGFILRKKYRWAIGTSVLLLLSHRTSFLIYIMTIGARLLYNQFLQKKWKWLIGEGVVCTAILCFTQHLWLPSLLHLRSEPNLAVYEGIFLYGQSFLSLTWPYMLLAVPGVCIYIKKKGDPLLPIFVLFTTLWVVLHLFFYNRILLYVNVALVLFASYFIASLKGRWKYILIIIFMTISMSQVVDFNRSRAPLISSAEIREIKEFNFPPGSFVVAMSANDAPWLLGYMKYSTRLAGPGLFEDRKSYEDWQQFWSGKIGADFFDPFPRPLFVYDRSFPLPERLKQCAKKESQYFYQIICP